MNKLEDFFYNQKHKYIAKWEHYFEIYDRYFRRYINKEVNVLEIGIYRGGSLEMWKNYFGDKAKIFGVDVDPSCKSYEEENISIFIGSQEDETFINSLKKQLPKLDIIIDDGGHHMKQQKTSFNLLYDHLKEDGIYLCEDVHTSYWEEFGGGYKNKNSFVEFSKAIVDSLNGWYSEEKGFGIDKYTTSLKSVSFFDSIVVFEKGLKNVPKDIRIDGNEYSEKNYEAVLKKNKNFFSKYL
ncbi:MAG: class I SAM-dependent methyltransferase [Sediminibacterium sp.]